MERSLQEKQILEKIVSKSPKLHYKLFKHEDNIYGDEYIYSIPDEDKEEVLKSLWPFEDCPKMDDVLFDIHEGANIHFKDCLVLRWNERNLIVSPAYFHSGGMAIDIVVSDLFEVIIQNIKK